MQNRTNRSAYQKGRRGPFSVPYARVVVEAGEDDTGHMMIMKGPEAEDAAMQEEQACREKSRA